MSEKTNKIINSFLIIAIIVTGIAGILTIAKASNHADTSYSFTYVSEFNTVYRAKEDNTKVYCYPQTGVNAYYRVHGSDGTSNSSPYGNCSQQVYLNIGTKYSITNYVNEIGYANARIHCSIGYSVPTTMSGVWSPDSLYYYTIVG